MTCSPCEFPDRVNPEKGTSRTRKFHICFIQPPALALTTFAPLYSCPRPVYVHVTLCGYMYIGTCVCVFLCIYICVCAHTLFGTLEWGVLALLSIPARFSKSKDILLNGIFPFRRGNELCHRWSLITSPDVPATLFSLQPRTLSRCTQHV